MKLYYIVIKNQMHNKADIYNKAQPQVHYLELSFSDQLTSWTISPCSMIDSAKSIIIT